MFVHFVECNRVARYSYRLVSRDLFAFVFIYNWLEIDLYRNSADEVRFRLTLEESNSKDFRSDVISSSKRLCKYNLKNATFHKFTNMFSLVVTFLSFEADLITTFCLFLRPFPDITLYNFLGKFI